MADHVHSPDVIATGLCPHPPRTRYRTRSVEVDAVQWTGSNVAELLAWAAYNVTRQPGDGLSISTPAGTVWARLNDWIIRDESGHFRCMTPAAFERAYEPA